MSDSWGRNIMGLHDPNHRVWNDCMLGIHDAGLYSWVLVTLAVMGLDHGPHFDVTGFLLSQTIAGKGAPAHRTHHSARAAWAKLLRPALHPVPFTNSRKCSCRAGIYFRPGGGSRLFVLFTKHVVEKIAVNGFRRNLCAAHDGGASLHCCPVTLIVDLSHPLGPGRNQQ